MKKNILIVILTVLMAAPTFGNEMNDKYFSSQEPKLNAQERAALAISKKRSGRNMKPMVGPEGSIQFVFGAQQPNIVCAVLQVCDVALQPGEMVNSIHMGDTVRWTVEPAITGSGTTEIQHLIIKPMDVGLKTSLVVTTDRRTYHFKLRSHRTQYMSQIAFIYPGDALAKWDAINKREAQKWTEQTIPQTGEYLGDLDFEYDLSGSAPWKPLRVYNNKRSTIIEMPDTMAQTEAPTLLIIRKEGNFFTDDETVIVNYRVQNNRYIVDTVFDQAILIAGIGHDQDRVTIKRK